MIQKNIGPFARTLFTKDVVHSLRMDIILGKLLPGSRVVETQLAQELGVSRGPIRTALQFLEQEGLVESLSNGGTRIVGFTLKNASDMYDFRLLLEKSAIATVIQNLTTNFHPLLNVIDLMMNINKRGGIANLTDTVSAIDIQFHRSIMVMAENQPMLQAWNTMANTLYTVLSITNTSHNRFEDYVIQHKEMADLIIQRSPAILEKLEEHIRLAKEILLHRLSKVMDQKLEEG